MSAPEDIREMVRKRYAQAATRSAAGDHDRARAVETSRCGPASAPRPQSFARHSRQASSTYRKEQHP